MNELELKLQEARLEIDRIRKQRDHALKDTKRLDFMEQHQAIWTKGKTPIRIVFQNIRKSIDDEIAACPQSEVCNTASGKPK